MVSYPIKYKAAMIKEIGKPLEIGEIEFNGPLSDGQVLVKLFYSGVCGKQIEEIDGLGGPDAYLPHLTGHEGSAVVIDTNPGVSKVKKGDAVVLHWRKGSGTQSSTPNYTENGKKINAGWVTTFNEYAVVSENRITKISHDSNMLVAALMGCVVTTGVGVVFNVANVQSYDMVTVFGCGGVGLCAVQAARLRQAGLLIAVDINQNSLDMAKKFGADVLINPKNDDVIKKIKELTKGKGVTKALVCTGSIAAIESAVESTSIPGECFLVGVPQKGAKISIEAHAVMHKRNIKGTLGGGSFPDRDIPAYMSLYNQGLLKLDEFVSVVRPFSEINDVIQMMRGDTPGRVAVKF